MIQDQVQMQDWTKKVSNCSKLKMSCNECTVMGSGQYLPKNCSTLLKLLKIQSNMNDISEPVESLRANRKTKLRLKDNKYPWGENISAGTYLTDYIILFLMFYKLEHITYNIFHSFQCYLKTKSDCLDKTQIRIGRKSVLLTKNCCRTSLGNRAQDSGRWLETIQLLNSRRLAVSE